MKRGKYNIKTRQELNTKYLAENDFENLLINNRPFIITIAKTFHNPDLLQDLTQEGEIGLYKAYSTFNQELGNPFLGYAKPIILNEMRSFMIKHGNTVRTPISMIRKKEETMSTISLNTQINENGDILEYLIPSEVSEPQNDNEWLKMALNSLKKDNYKKYLMMYLGVDKDMNEIGPLSIKQIAELEGVSRQNVNEIINKVLNTIRSNERIHKAASAVERN